MPVTYRIDLNARLVITTARGDVSAEEIHASQEQLAADPSFDPSFNHLFEVSDIENLDIGTAEVRRLAAIKLFDETSRRAMFAPEDALFGLSRMYEAFRHLSDSNLRVFRDRDQALAWLASD